MNGDEALGKFRDEVPDLVILDIQMPGMNGIEVLRQMKMIDATVPVILSSHLFGVSARFRGFSIFPVTSRRICF